MPAAVNDRAMKIRLLVCMHVSIAVEGHLPTLQLIMAIYCRVPERAATHIQMCILPSTPDFIFNPGLRKNKPP